MAKKASNILPSMKELTDYLNTQNGSVRASIGYFNTIRDIDTFTNAIKEITK